VKAQLVPSIAGKHEGWEKVLLNGHPRLMKAVRDIGMRVSNGDCDKELILECQVCPFFPHLLSFLNLVNSRCRAQALDNTQRPG
jgi:tyrosyl-DNA phosphodiesterase 1